MQSLTPLQFGMCSKTPPALARSCNCHHRHLLICQAQRCGNCTASSDLPAQLALTLGIDRHEQATYIAGQSVRIMDADGKELARIQKQPQDICNQHLQRSLLVKRETLRMTSSADTETFLLTTADGTEFQASRTYPGVEVDIIQSGIKNSPAASLTRSGYTAAMAMQVEPSPSILRWRLQLSVLPVNVCGGRFIRASRFWTPCLRVFADVAPQHTHKLAIPAVAVPVPHR